MPTDPVWSCKTRLLSKKRNRKTRGGEHHLQIFFHFSVKTQESLIDLQEAGMRDNLIIVGILEQVEEKEATLTTHNPEAATTLGRHY